MSLALQERSHVNLESPCSLCLAVRPSPHHCCPGRTCPNPTHLFHAVRQPPPLHTVLLPPSAWIPFLSVSPKGIAYTTCRTDIIVRPEVQSCVYVFVGVKVSFPLLVSTKKDFSLNIPGSLLLPDFFPHGGSPAHWVPVLVHVS